jgi:hypothetical protein
MSRSEPGAPGSGGSDITTTRKTLSKLSDDLSSGRVDKSLLEDLGWQPAQLASFVRRYEAALVDLKEPDSEGEVSLESNLDSGEVVAGGRGAQSVGRIDSAGAEAQKDNARALEELPREAVLPQYQPIVDEYYRNLTGGE